ncbi:MAG: methyltransferase domain-containing protein [Proteobacteria bacterium]|nr:methyltransferase domain-containing protein [Pseudomonadota bacterium]
MDKENKDMANTGNASYDPDAAELLKDLEDDDDDFVPPPTASSPVNRSLVNILTSSSNFEALATYPSLPAVPPPPGFEPASSADYALKANEADKEEDESPVEADDQDSDDTSDEAALEDEDEEEEEEDADEEVTQRFDRTPVLPEAESVAETPEEAVPAKEVPVKESVAAKEAAPAKEVSQPAAADEKAPETTPLPSTKSIAPIKPFDTKFTDKTQRTKGPKEKAKGEKEKPKTDSGLRPVPVEKPDRLPEVPVVPAEKSAPEPEASAERPAVPVNAGPQSGPNKRPPGLPPMPPVTAAPAPNARVLKDGEFVMTVDAINDLLPGGKLDEGKDLAAFKHLDNNWYSKVFNEDYFRTIPKSMPRQSAREARFIIDRLGIESGARVLDLCCGFGRHTIELAAKGFDMVGLDLSMVMLKKALADAQAKGQAIKFVHGDMRKLTFKAIFDAIYNVDTSFGYFDELSNFRVLQGIFNALKPGGVFLIETMNRDFIVDDLPMRLWWKGKECMLLEEIDIDQLSGFLSVQRSFVFDDPKRPPWEQKIQIRLYSVTEMRALLMRAGFSVVELSGDYSLPGAYFGATSPKNIFVAEKPIH